MSTASNYEITPAFRSLVNLLFKLFHYPPPPAENIAALKLATTDDVKIALTNHLGTSPSPVLIDTIRNILDLSYDEIYHLEGFAREINLDHSSVSPETTTYANYLVFPPSAPKYLKALPKGITAELAVQSPRTVLPVIFARIQDTDPKQTPEKLARLFAPLAKPIIQSDPELSNLHSLVQSVFTQSGIDPKLAQSASDQLVIHQLGMVFVTPKETGDYIKKFLLVEIESKSGRPIPEELGAQIVADQIKVIGDFEHSRLSDQSADLNTEVDTYVKKLNLRSTDILSETPDQPLVERNPAGNFVFTGTGRILATRQTATLLTESIDSLPLAVKKIREERESLKQVRDQLLSNPNNLRDPKKLKELDQVFEKMRYLALLNSSLRIRQIHLDIAKRNDIEKPTRIENELTAQFVTTGVSPTDARKVAREFINSGLAATTYTLASFAGIGKNRLEVLEELTKEALGHLQSAHSDLSAAITKINDGKLNYDSLHQAYDKQTNWNQYQANPQPLFQMPQVPDFVRNLYAKPASQLKSKLTSQTLEKFASTEFGKKLAAKGITQTAAKIITTQGVKKTLSTTLATALAGIPVVGPILGWIAGEIIGKAIEKIVDYSKRFLRWAKERLKIVAAAVAFAIGTAFFGPAVGAMAAFGTYLGGTAFSVVSGSPGTALSSGVAQVTTVTTAVITEAAGSSIAPLAISVIAVPIVVALMLFIINASAYVTPPFITRGGIGGATPSCWPTVGQITQDPYARTVGTCYDSAGNPATCTHASGSDANAFDIGNFAGTPIYATHDGTIEYAGWGELFYTGYGNLVVIAGDGFKTLYGHFQNIEVSAGDQVKAGDLLGAMNSTGNSTGNHLHYELRGLGDLTDYVPEGWRIYIWNNTYPGTCFANESGGISP